MLSSSQKASVATFAVTLLCFFLPFVQISCSGQPIARFSGVQMVTGVELPNSPMGRNKAGPEPLAILSLGCAVAGIALSLSAGRILPVARTVIGGLGAVMLLILKSRLENSSMKETAGVVQVEPLIGFWLAFLTFIIAAAINGYGASGKVEPPA